MMVAPTSNPLKGMQHSLSQVLNHIFEELRILICTSQLKSVPNDKFSQVPSLIFIIGSCYRLFHKLDADHNSHLTLLELEKITENVKFREPHLNHETSVKEIMQDFDQNDDQTIDESEFLRGVTHWLRTAKPSTKEHHDKVKYIHTPIWCV